jgi:hypothetical protein
MKVKELVTLLQGLNQESEIYFLPDHGMYVRDFTPSIFQDVTIRGMFGGELKGTVIGSGGPVGSI